MVTPAAGNCVVAPLLPSVKISDSLQLSPTAAALALAPELVFAGSGLAAAAGAAIVASMAATVAAPRPNLAYRWRRPPAPCSAACRTFPPPPSPRYVAVTPGRYHLLWPSQGVIRQVSLGN